jgi:cation:H+ antiporter
MLTALLTVALTSVVIMFACESFEQATDHLGRRMPPGIKGATLNAVASSLPELITTFILLFFYRDLDGFSGGIATVAGSAVFNAVIIPCLCILAVTVWGVRQADGTFQRVPHIEVERATILRDGFFFIAAEVLLIVFLGDSTMAWWMGAAMMALYVVYFGVLMRQYRSGAVSVDDQALHDGEADDEPADQKGRLHALLTLDFFPLFFPGQAPTDRTAWIVLGAATAVISAACWGLSWAVVEVAQVLGVPLYFTTVIIAAAATSVPDTVISVKGAMEGDYDDAIANALGSNIFDICVALGLPLMLYGLVFGSVDLAPDAGGSADVQELRVVLLVVSGLLMGIFLWGEKIDRKKAWWLLGLYGLWTAYVVARGMQRHWELTG